MKLPKNKEDIFDHDIAPQLSTSVAFPLCSLGFHHFIHSVKDYMETTKEIERKEVYYVLNPFEHKIDNFDKSLINLTPVYLELDGAPNVLSRGFYKMWEMIMMFDLISTKSNFISAHLAEGPGAFIQAVMFYRDKFSPKASKSDKYYAITLHREDTDGHVPPLAKEFVDYYAKEKPRRFIQHETHSLKQSGGSADRDNGDLTDPKTIKLFGGQIGKDKADLITSDGGIEFVNENTQEQEAFQLILGQIITALTVQAKGGHYVCKLFESFTTVTAKIIYLLRQFYEEVYIFKPLMSRQSNSEKYLICKGFISDKVSKQTDTLMKVLTTMRKDKRYLNDIFPSFSLPKEFESHLITINTQIANKQLVAINNIIKYIQSNNFFGDQYHNSRQKQIEATQYWVNKFYPMNEKDKNASIKLNEKEVDGLVSENEKKTEELNKKLRD
jgi:23S rRNA U2552 (ribose-2'-O)-methylase RlmE/FtsJ